MVTFRQKGERLSAFVVAANAAGEDAEEAAVRRAAYGAGKDIRAAARQRLSGLRWRVWNAAGLPKSIRVKRMGEGWWQVNSKATYRQKRTQKVDLLWVFDTGAPSFSGRGKSYVAVPIPGQAPIAQNGRRYAWPSEAAAMGVELEFVAVPGKDSVLVMGRKGRDPWRPMWVLRHRTKQMKRLDLAGIHRKHEARLADYWAEAWDKSLAKRLKRAA